MDAGDSVNVSTLTMSAHTATHIDAPFHFEESGARAGELDLTPFWGPAIVLDLTASLSPSAVIDCPHFADIDLSRAPRLLLHTGAWTDPALFPTQIPTLTKEAVSHLAAHGVLLIGIDLPSVDTLDSTTLPIHRALGAANIRILESIDLTNVPAGEYELTALPLRLMTADGAPVRAVLRTL